MKKPKAIKVTTSTVEDFFSRAKGVMRAADRGTPIKKQCATLSFVDPTDMLHFLSATKIKLVNSIRNHPSSITEIAHFTKRNRSAVYRDIHEMEKFGLVKTHKEINPGHGRCKTVELVAPVLKLEATI